MDVRVGILLLLIKLQPNATAAAYAQPLCLMHMGIMSGNTEVM